MSPPAIRRAPATGTPSASPIAALTPASTWPLSSVVALEVREETTAGALADVEHLFEAVRAAVVWIWDFGVGRCAGLERAQQAPLGPIAIVARQPQQLVPVGAIHRQHVIESLEVGS